MTALALVLALTSLAFAAFPFVEVTSRGTLWLLPFAFLGPAWAPYLVLSGALGAVLGWVSGSTLAAVAGGLAALLSADYVVRVTAAHDGLERAFGRAPPGSERGMLARRWTWGVPRAPEAVVTRDVPFCTIPGSDRKLLCDVWQPPPGVEPSGTVLVYLHGSAWYLIDKDVGTRPFFRHLTAQGHVVMDVAYRLCPEASFVGMVADAKRAVAWMKIHSWDYGALPDRIVLMGGSAGAHIALLAAYTPANPWLTPEDLRGVDTSVRAVVSYYGVADMRSYERNARRFEPSGPARDATDRPPSTAFARTVTRIMFGPGLKPEQMPPLPAHRQMMRELIGGLPEEVPELYDLASPVHHVGSASPPTLLLHGEHDHIVPVASVRRLHRALAEADVPVVYIEYPRTQHAFDLLLPPLIAPAGQAALFELERFLVRVAASPAARSTPAQLPAAAE